PKIKDDEALDLEPLQFEMPDGEEDNDEYMHEAQSDPEAVVKVEAEAQIPDFTIHLR
ncbi:hypothetical protein A2U01_0067746, partial [Trifolium medium]|nr:hypothetical protein [Trifolium medium]